jgi:5'-deoxynucleotidase YfbR-like HD superfamily hydrolase
MSQDCPNCEVLQAQNVRLRAEIRRLYDRLSRLEVQFNRLVRQVDALRAFVEREQVEPTIPRHKLIAAVTGRLSTIVDNARSEQ